ncbi:MAG: DUF4352 domain-containing protein [Bacilli bacterium]
MKVCKDCGKEVSKSAKSCPNCGKKLKKPIVLFVILGIIVIAIIGAMISGKEEDSRKKEFKQNDVATYKNVDYSITKVERTIGKEYFEAKDGKEYIVITIKIENKSDSKISYNGLDWKLEDSTGDENSYTLWGGDNDLDLNSGDLNPNGIKTGTIAFEIPKDNKDLTLKYYDSILSSERAFEFDITD